MLKSKYLNSMSSYDSGCSSLGSIRYDNHERIKVFMTCKMHNSKFKQKLDDNDGIVARFEPVNIVKITTDGSHPSEKDTIDIS